MTNMNVSFKTKNKSIAFLLKHIFIIIINYLFMERKPILTNDVMHAIRQAAAII